MFITRLKNCVAVITIQISETLRLNKSGRVFFSMLSYFTFINTVNKLNLEKNNHNHKKYVS